MGSNAQMPVGGAPPRPAMPGGSPGGKGGAQIPPQAREAVSRALRGNPMAGRPAGMPSNPGGVAGPAGPMPMGPGNMPLGMPRASQMPVGGGLGGQGPMPAQMPPGLNPAALTAAPRPENVYPGPQAGGGGNFGAGLQQLGIMQGGGPQPMPQRPAVASPGGMQTPAIPRRAY